MKSIVIIPARMGASRFPGKPMHLIDGVPLVGHCLLNTRMNSNVDAVCVATCDPEIADYVESVGGEVVLTSKDHNRATDRTAEGLETYEAQHNTKYDIVIMVQGDEPLVSSAMLDDILVAFESSPADVVNLMSRLPTEESFRDPNNVKVVFDENGHALYFSREPIPSPWKGFDQTGPCMQVGIIGFRRSALLEFNSMLESRLEKIESVDMNRLLESGKRIRMVLTEKRMIGVDTEEDARQVEQIIQSS